MLWSVCLRDGWVSKAMNLNQECYKFTCVGACLPFLFGLLKGVLGRKKFHPLYSLPLG